MPITGFRPLPLAGTSTPETITEDKWHQPLSEPTRRLGLSAALIVASGAFYIGAAPFNEAVSADRFVQPISQPQLVKRGLPTNEQQSVAFVPFIASAETITTDKWYRPLSEPVRVRVSVNVASQQATAYIGADPFPERVTADRWAQPLSQPTYAKPRIQPPAVAFSGHVEVTQWYVAFTEPQRSRLGLPVREQQSVAYIGASPFPETVSADRWAYPTSQPTYAKPRIQPDAVSYGLGEVVNPDKWFVPLSEPQRTRPRLGTPSQQSVAYIGASPFAETVTADRWAQPLSTPTLAKRKVQPDSVSYAYFVAPSTETVTVDKWYVELSSPVRQRIGLAAFQQQAVAYIGAAPFNESVTADRWAQPLSEPQRARIGLPVREQQSTAYIGAAPFPETVSADRFVQPLSQPTYAIRKTQPDAAVFTFAEAVTADRWAQPLSVPYFGKRLLTAEQQSVAYVGFSPFTEAVSADRWAYQTSQPTYAKRQVQPDSAVNSPFVVPSNEVITPDKWFVALSEPQRPRIGLAAQEQQSSAYIGAAPFTETVSIDRWLGSVSDPVRFRLGEPAYQQQATTIDPVALTLPSPPVIVVENDPGGRIVGGHFSRGKWRAFQEAEYARKQAAEKASELKRKKVREAAEAAAELADRAIQAAQVSTANIEVERLTRSLNALAGAVALSETMKAARRTVLVANAIIQQIADQEDEDEIEMLILGS